MDGTLNPVGNELAEAPADEWRRISPKQIWVEIWGNLIFFGIAIGAAVFVWLVWNWWTGWYAVAVFGALLLITLVTTPRRVRAIGYRLRDDDLLFRKGVLAQRFIAVPYGRMQLIDVTRGPIARAYGLASLKFLTAAPSASVILEGLTAEDADALRDRLVELAESRRAGL